MVIIVSKTTVIEQQALCRSNIRQNCLWSKNDIFCHNVKCKINTKYELNTRLLNNWKTKEYIVNSNCILYNKRYTLRKKVWRRYFKIIIIKTTNAFLYDDNGCFRVSFVYRSYTSFAVVYSPNNCAFNYRDGMHK